MKIKDVSKAVIIAILCVLCMFTQGYAASAKVSIDCPKEIKKGETFEAIVKYEASDLSRVYAELEYNQNEIEYISGGNSSGNSGWILLKKANDEGGTLNFKLKFKAIKNGETSFRIDTIEAYDINEMFLEVSPYEGKIKIDTETSLENIDSEDNADENQVNNQPTVEDENQENNSETNNNTLMFWGIGIAVIILVLAIILLVTRKKKK